MGVAKVTVHEMVAILVGSGMLLRRARRFRGLVLSDEGAKAVAAFCCPHCGKEIRA